MGSEAHVIVVGDRRLLDVARARIDDLEARWSRFRPTSEVSRLNATAGGPLAVSEETRSLVTAAIAGWRLTGGVFDPTVLGDVIRSGYDRSFPMAVVRRSGGISLLQRNCGGIVVDPVAGTVTLPADTGFDPGGIGKGFAADVVVAELLDDGAEAACVNLGGDLRAEGCGPDGDRWVVALPAAGDDVAVAIASGAVATSTTGKRAWKVGDEQRHHLVDPASGRPGASAVETVTAIARTAALAEIATKAAIVGAADAVGATRALTALGVDGMALEADRSATTDGFGRFVVDGGRWRGAA
jgi:thiamine biosynthesis lipoprotein